MVCSNDKPLISVIVPAYNVEKYIEDCINSIINQTYENLEILIVDDGSTDSTGDICDKFAEKDNRIKVIHQANGGMSEARNTALKHMTGEYIACIDSDDFVTDNYLNMLYSALKENKADMAMCNFRNVTQTAGYNISQNNNKDMFGAKYLDSRALQKELYKSGNIRYVTVWGKLYKKRLFKGIRMPVGRRFEDMYIAPFVFSRVRKAVVFDNRNYCYRVRKGSIMQKKDRHNMDIVQALGQHILYYVKKHEWELATDAAKFLKEMIIEKFLKN